MKLARLPLVGSVVLGLVALAACGEERPPELPTPPAPSAPAPVASASAAPAPVKAVEVDTSSVPRKDLNRLAQELALPLYWSADQNGNGRLDPSELYADASRSAVRARFHFLRQQGEKKEKREPNRSLADFVAPKGTGLADHLGAFAVSTGFGLKELCDGFRAKQDDYNAIMAEAIADRLAEAFAECLHERVRKEWGYGEGESLPPADLIAEKYRGIRPAAGYPACPDHTEKGTLWSLLDVEKNAGMSITESFAMWPGSSVSGLYFAHPEARYFTLGKIERDQVQDYASRKGMTVQEVERWLGPNLNYDRAS